MIPPAVSCPNTRAVLSTREAPQRRRAWSFIWSWSRKHPLPGMYLKFQTPCREVGAQHKPYCLFKLPRNREPPFSIQGMLGTLPDPSSGCQRRPQLCTQASAGVAASGLGIRLFSWTLCSISLDVWSPVSPSSSPEACSTHSRFLSPSGGLPAFCSGHRSPGVLRPLPSCHVPLTPSVRKSCRCCLQTVSSLAQNRRGRWWPVGRLGHGSVTVDSGLEVQEGL